MNKKTVTPEQKEQIRKILKMRTMPDIFIEKILGCETLEEFQRTVCRLFAEHDKLNVMACHAVGKTWLLARITLAFLYLYPHSKVITTAPTYRQVQTLLWGEIRKAKKSDTVTAYLEGTLLDTSIKIDDDWFAIGFSPKKGAATDSAEQQGSSFQGYHARYILVIFDEATGVPPDIYTMAEGLMTSGEVVKWVCIANPTTRASQFYKNTKLADWFTHTINCFDSPNMIANGFTSKRAIEKEINILKKLSDVDRLARIKAYKKPNHYLINAQWVIAKIYQWGFDHPLAKGKIFAEFPNTEDNTIIKYDSLLNAFNREVITDEGDHRAIGIDVARYGEDSTVFTDIVGNKVAGKEVHNQKSATEVTGDAIRFFKETDIKAPTRFIIDATGVGSGVVDGLREAKRNGDLPDYVTIIEVHFSQAVEHPDEKKKEEYKKTHENLKALMFDLLNEDLRDRLDLPNEEIYDEELPVILFKYSKRGKLMVESKDDFKARFGKSPDASDSLALANLAKYLRATHGSFLDISHVKKPEPYSKRNESRKRPRKSRIKGKEY